MNSHQVKVCRFILPTLLLLSSCSKHPTTGDQYVNKTTREIITVAGVGNGHDLYVADTSRLLMTVYSRLDSAKTCVRWIDSSSDTRHWVYITSAETFDSTYTILSPRIKLHPRKGDWYENLGTRERVKIEDVGTGKDCIGPLYNIKKDLGSVVPMMVMIHGDSAQTANSQSVVIHETEHYGGIIIMKYSVFKESDFERDHILVH